MMPSTRKKLLYVLLGLAVLWGAYNMNVSNRAELDANLPPTPAGVTPALVATRFYVDLEAYRQLPWGADPFRVPSSGTVTHRTSPGPAARTSAASWRLSGILYSDQQPLAIINNRPVGVGDRVDGATVVEIKKRQVTVESDGRRISLTVTAKG